MAWYTDGGLVKLDQQMRDKYPGIVIYHIGDDDHKERISDHNPEEDGSVDASDFMVRGKFDRNAAEWLFETLIKSRDKRIAYVIWEDTIVSSTVQPWKKRKHNGAFHGDHVHLSVNDKHENDRTEWKLEEKMRKPTLELDELYLPVVKQGESDSDFGGYNLVGRIQSIVGVKRDGDYGPDTAKAIGAWIGTGPVKTVDLDVWIKLYGLSQR